MNKRSELTSLRGIFILFIVLFHCRNVFEYSFGVLLNTIYYYGGAMGNCFFFLLSGYLMEENYAEKIKQMSFNEYIKKRMYISYPVYFLSNNVALLINIIHTKSMLCFDVYTWIRVMTMTIVGWPDDRKPYNSPSWFLCVLLLCYIVYYLINKIDDNEIKTFLYCVMVLLGLCILKEEWNQPFLNSSLGNGYYCFFCGVITLKVMKTIKTSHIKRITNIAIIAMVFILWGCKNFGVDIFIGDWDFVFATFCCPAIILTASNNAIIKSVLNWKPLVILGNVSLFVFLWHRPILTIFEIVMDSNIIIVPEVWFAMYMIVLLIVCCAFHYFFDKILRSRCLNIT